MVAFFDKSLLAGSRDVVAGGGTGSRSLEPSGKSREGEGESVRRG